MNYPLAKELEDTGFPQNGDGYITGAIDGSLDTSYVPTLSELIEACGQDFNDLQQMGGRDATGLIIPEGPYKWRASSFKYGSGSTFASGSTPEEAVARLWLALNPKKV